MLHEALIAHDNRQAVRVYLETSVERSLEVEPVEMLKPRPDVFSEFSLMNCTSR